MRQGQQHRRGRGRNNNSSSSSNHSQNNNNNHRKGQNPLARSFESNGPDVKVRGTPAHVAEKYISLARDAQTSGDPVLAENYLQHAEHYNRIILAYREQQGGDAVNGNRPVRVRTDDMEGEDDEGGDDFGQGEQPAVQRPASDQQRSFEGQRTEDRSQDARPADQPQQQQNRYRDRPRHDRFDRQDRQDRGDRGGDRGDRGGDRGDRPERVERTGDRAPFERASEDRAVEVREPRVPRERAPDEQPMVDTSLPRGDVPATRSDAPQGRRRERFGPGNEQPDFLRRPVRRPRREPEAGAGEPQAAATDEPPRE